MDSLPDFENQNIRRNTTASIQRPDGQTCPVEESIDKGTGELKQKIKSAKFYSFNQKNYKAKLHLSMHHPKANAILDFMISEMDGTNAICISQATLSKVFGITRQALRPYIDILVEKKFIEIFKSGNMNCYAVNAFVVFTQGDANLWKAKFTATMYIDYEEQTADIKTKYSKTIEKKGA